MNGLLNFSAIMIGISMGIWLGMIVDPSWIGSIRRGFWKLVHRKGCPFPLKPLRKERLRSYRSYDGLLGIPFQAEVFDIRAMCSKCGRVHRVEMKVFHQIYPHS